MNNPCRHQRKHFLTSVKAGEVIQQVHFVSPKKKRLKTPRSEGILYLTSLVNSCKTCRHSRSFTYVDKKYTLRFNPPLLTHCIKVDN
jgi:hypothetical protein